MCKLSIKFLSQIGRESRIKSVRAIKYQAPIIRYALIQLAKISKDPKTKIKVTCLVTYEVENFEFLLAMCIWYDMLFVVNTVSKIFQSKYMHIDIAIDQLKGLIIY